MSRLILLDAGPVGLLSKALGRPDAARCRGWLDSPLRGEDEVAVPEIARHEVRRELFRLGMSGGLARLDQLHPKLIRLPIAGDVMDVASELWAGLRRAGRPTAGDKALDGDAILAAQAFVAARDGQIVIVATGNVQHLDRFTGLDARQWDLIR